MAKHSMKESYASGSSMAHGPGALKAAMSRNPNSYSMVNDSPCGPYSHCMGYDGDGGMQGDTSVSHRGASYHFK